MKNLIKSIVILAIIIFFTNQLFSSETAKTKYNIEETTEILKSSKIGKIKLDHDDHVYKCMKISKKAKDLEGAVDVLIAGKTNLGYTLDDEEVDLLIQISNLDTQMYENILLGSKKIGKKKTTVKEHFSIIKELSNGNGKYLLTGIERAAECKYKIENDYFSWERLNILIQVGKLEKEDRFMEIYAAMRSVGIDSNVNSKGLEVLYKLYRIDGDVPHKISAYLKVNKWKSRKQPGEREYMVIKDLMKANYVAFDQKSDYDRIQVVKGKAPVNKERKIVKKSKKRYYAKTKTNKKSKKSKKSYKNINNSYNPCSAYISKN